jgi:hypothetical protein
MIVNGEGFCKSLLTTPRFCSCTGYCLVAHLYCERKETPKAARNEKNNKAFHHKVDIQDNVHGIIIC